MASAKVLLLESERTTVPSFAPALEKRGYNVTVEHESQAALKRAQSLGPDILILDAASFKTSGARYLPAHAGSEQRHADPVDSGPEDDARPEGRCDADALLAVHCAQAAEQRGAPSAGR